LLVQALAGAAAVKLAMETIALTATWPRIEDLTIMI
jgi:hypothetical protein